MTDQKLPSLRRDEYQVAMERCWLMLDEEGGVLEPLGDVLVRPHLANVFAASAVRSVDLRVASPVYWLATTSNVIAQALVLPRFDVRSGEGLGNVDVHDGLVGPEALKRVAMARNGRCSHQQDDRLSVRG